MRVEGVSKVKENLFMVGEESEEENVAFFPAELWISAGVLYMQLYLSKKEL